MTNQEIQNNLEKAFNKRKGIRVGDFVYITGSDVPVRVSEIWGKVFQTTTGGSFYLGMGGAEYSGALDPAVPVKDFILTGEVKPGRFWHFDRGIPRAHSGVEFYIPCRVFRQISSHPGEDGDQIKLSRRYCPIYGT